LCKFTHLQSILNHINGYSKKSWIQFLLISGIIWLIFVDLHINRHLDDMIIGLHYWRKSDTYAQIMNYYYNGLNFFDHGIYYNQMNTNGKAIAEFPLIYWLIALQLKLFGKSLIIIRLNWILILIGGLYSTFKISNYFLKNIGLSLFVALILFLSPIFSAYLIAFLPDPLALNIVFIGLWLLLKSTQNNKRKTLVLALLIIGIGGMIKPFFLIPYLAFIATVLVNQFFLKKEGEVFKIIYLLPIILVGIWFFYTNWYNAKVGSDYFLSEARPIWNYTAMEISSIWHRVVDRWVIDYIHPNLLWMFFTLIIANLMWWPKDKITANVYFLFSIIGCFSFCILFFNMFEQHDYYIYPLLSTLPLTFGLFIYKMMRFSKNSFVKNGVSLLLLFTVFLGLNHTWVVIEDRRKTPRLNSKSLFESYQNLEYFLLKNKIKKSDKVITFSDKSPSMALTLLNRKGWSGYQTNGKHEPLDNLIKKGASYLIINKNAPIMKDSTMIVGYLDFYIDDTNNVYLYDLKPYKTE
jgi:4-amino-4-deoxy-L-arabinose transferase-like glycosyltransferase